MKKILITGIQGFVGQYLVKELQKTCVDAEINGSYHFEHEFDNNAEYKLHKCNIQSPKEVDMLIQTIVPDEMYHLAALSSVSGSFDNISATMMTNCMGTVFLLESVKNYAPNCRILIVGSSNEYGNTDLVPIKEDQRKEPPNPYAVSKLAAGYIAAQYHTFHNLKTVITRSFNHTGPGQALGFVVPDFCRQISHIETGEQAPVMNVGSIDVSRDFLDVRDVVSAYVTLMKCGLAGEVYNVCSGMSYNIKDILDKLISFSSVNITVESKKRRKKDITDLYGDNTKLRSLGWSIHHPFFSTLEENLNYWRKR